MCTKQICSLFYLLYFQIILTISSRLKRFFSWTSPAASHYFDLCSWGWREGGDLQDKTD